MTDEEEAATVAKLIYWFAGLGTVTGEQMNAVVGGVARMYPRRILRRAAGILADTVADDHQYDVALGLVASALKENRRFVPLSKEIRNHIRQADASR